MHMIKLFTAIGIGTLLSALGMMATRVQSDHGQNLAPSSRTAVSMTGAAKLEKAVFAGGCFWGMEYYFQHAKGVVSTEVGYTGGHTKNPTYREVCSHTTGHIEALQVTYDANVTSYEELARLFFEIHDPTQANGQGPDIGEQYLSVVFYADEMQKKTTEKLIGLLKSRGYAVVTQLRPAATFWKAEEYHQKYYEKENGTPYCHRPVKRFG
jgi:peptide methionine sulfoxide reductase msrA/msrB